MKRRRKTISDSSEPSALPIGALLLTSSALLGALLMFGMEPIVGRMVLVHFGGGAQVWLTCLMFFQVVLFLGYLYSHTIGKHIGRWHLVLLLLPLINLPLGIHTEVAADAPLMDLLWLLIRQVGLPFFALSTTAVIAQSWWAKSPLGRIREPYPLYAASNLGSLVALLAYPFIVEPLLGLHVQGMVWTAFYGVYALLLAFTWRAVQPILDEVDGVGQHETPTPPTIREGLVWVGLSALPSGFLLAVTNLISSEIGSLPLVWVLTLVVYLLSFVLVFRDRPIGATAWANLWPEIALVGGVAYLVASVAWWMLVLQLLLLFAFCMACHGTLYLSRPHPKFLTWYYVTVSFGGMVGGVTVNLGAPVVFSTLAEYPISLFGLVVLLGWLHRERFFSFWKDASIVVGGSRFAILACLGTVVGVGMYGRHHSEVRVQNRNFYGVLRVYDKPEEAMRYLFQGATVHGMEGLSEGFQGVPQGYYHLDGAFQEALRTVPSPRHIAVIGLGTGGLAGRLPADDTMDFFEIDPDNETIAREWFSFLDLAGESVQVILGDGRMNLGKRGREGGYGAVVIDAFSGDWIPTHLLTQEAIQTYFDEIADDGLVLFHVSSRHYDLLPLMAANARDQGLYGARNIIAGYSGPALGPVPHQMVALAKSRKRLLSLTEGGWVDLSESDQGMASWTDDYVNILPLLKMDLF